MKTLAALWRTLSNQKKKIYLECPGNVAKCLHDVFAWSHYENVWEVE